MEETFHAKNLPVLFFANIDQPDGSSTDEFMKSYLSNLNNEEIEEVELMSIDWLPSSTGLST